jgi:septum formation protein
MLSTRRLVLASTSPYRAMLLERLKLTFERSAPGIAEGAIAGETPSATAARLAISKARAVAPRFPDALIIGSDQVASCGDRVLEKPGGPERARRQLAFLSGRSARFDTAVALLDAARGDVRCRVVPCRVVFRALTPAEIESYLEREHPWDCAGSARAEGLGIALLERIETEDPTSLVGLPLIALTGLLSEAGAPVLGG